MTADAWRPAPLMPGQCDHAHPPGGGSLDESARRLSHTELAVAELLCAEGHRVRSLSERPGRGRVADLDACGVAVEVKSWMPQADRHGPPGPRSVYNKLAGARSQAPTVVLYGTGSGLTPAVARAGLAEFSARGQWGRLAVIRVVGEGFDLSWTRTPGVRRGPERPGGVAARSSDRPSDRPGGVAARTPGPGLGAAKAVGDRRARAVPRARPPGLGW